jgi:DNA repair photolyase
LARRTGEAWIPGRKDQFNFDFEMSLVLDRPVQKRPRVVLPLPRRIDSRVGLWHAPAVIAENHFVYKSLSNWAFNVAVGCSHACRFCYVPSTATIKQGPKLAEYGVKDPDAEWGNYVLLRPWDEQKFLASLRAAENTPRKQLKPDGNRAVIYCSTTDPYQVIRHPDPARQRELAGHARFLVRRSLELIRDESTLNVRILTRSPLARADFDLFQSFGKRLVFGMSLPTLRNDLAKVYEPKAPAPSQRLATLHAAKDAGLYVFVAMAPTYPECDEADLRATLKAVAELKPITIFHEPINIRAENVARIEEQAESVGVPLRTEVFATRESWQNYAVNALHMVSELAKEIGISKRLHLWPDKSLGSQSLVERMPKPQRYQARLEHWWNRISEWPR